MRIKQIEKSDLRIKALFYFILILTISIPTLSFAQDFTATSIGDYGNVTVMEVTGNYDANNPDGSINAAPRRGFYPLQMRKNQHLCIHRNHL